MIARHRIPTIFNIYMVDVLCCALGCVILLWQLYYHDAQEQMALANEIQQKLQEANLALDTAKNDAASWLLALESSKKRETEITLDLQKTRADRDKALKLVVLARQEYDEIRKALALTEILLANLRKEHKDLEVKSKDTTAELAKKIHAHAALLAKLADADSRLRNMEKDLNRKQATILDAVKVLGDRTAQLKTADQRATMLEQQLAMLRTDVKGQQDKLATAELRARLLELDLEKSKKDKAGNIKDMAEARLLIATLQNENQALLKQARQIRIPEDQRFAGIALTGQRVVFLIDMSGSMVMLDENSELPDKWPLVCETIGKLMASLPNLLQFQVILFSDKVRYPFGGEGRWLNYDPKEGVKPTVEGLKAVKPNGETNMYAAFEEAFRYRPLGLDTIYVFSDGLPNAGEGLPVGSKAKDPQRGEILTRHLRQQLRTGWNRPISGQPKVRINTIGFFFESPDVGAFLWALAREHDGSFVGMSKP